MTVPTEKTAPDPKAEGEDDDVSVLSLERLNGTVIVFHRFHRRQGSSTYFGYGIPFYGPAILKLDGEEVCRYFDKEIIWGITPFG